MFPVLLISLCTLAATVPEAVVVPTLVSDTELKSFQKNYVDHRLNTAGWSGNFHQEAHSPDLLEPITSDGNLTYRVPASLEMSYTAPLVGQVWIQKDEVGQKFTGRSPQVAAAPMVRSLLEFFRQPPSAWEKDFTQTAQRDHDVVRIQLIVKPGAATGQPSRIVVEVNALTFDPQRLEIVFAEKASLVFIFSNWISLGPPSAIPLEPPAHDPTRPPPRPGVSPRR